MKINIGTLEEATKKSKPLSHRVHFQSVASRLGEDEEGYDGYNCDSTIAASCEQPSVDYNQSNAGYQGTGATIAVSQSLGIAPPRLSRKSGTPRLTIK